jgi:hypothetical protein
MTSLSRTARETKTPLAKNAVNALRDDCPAREMAHYDASVHSIRQGEMSSHEILQKYFESEQ